MLSICYWVYQTSSQNSRTAERNTFCVSVCHIKIEQTGDRRGCITDTSRLGRRGNTKEALSTTIKSRSLMMSVCVRRKVPKKATKWHEFLYKYCWAQQQRRQRLGCVRLLLDGVGPYTLAGGFCGLTD